MRAHELRLGRSFGLVFDHGDDFYTALDEFCRTHHIRQGYIPSFIAGFSEVDLVGACDRLDDPAAPVWSKVHLRNVEAFGGGTLAYAPDSGELKPHIHVAIGLKEHAASGYTSHLLGATVQFLTEMLVIEVLTPDMTRKPQSDLYNVPLLRFDTAPGHGPTEPR
ncbi:PPC domain-containing DNA-binding protein [Nocardia sp. NPDC004568]|uniref:PPC domain-containing DNA-binding protein n=1 Tax=Nocardia sp. NPDC004568 TaxID=3154551 RepID=UPI0033A789A3